MKELLDGNKGLDHFTLQVCTENDLLELYCSRATHTHLAVGAEVPEVEVGPERES